MTRTLGRYQLTERLGRGGMGEVWRARDPALRRDVAVKVLRRDGEDASETLRDDFVQRFLREARAAASLKHPNVVAIHDVGVDAEPYIVMEWVEGASLRGFIGDASIPVARRIEWLVEIARALAAAHELGLVHRDIKPDNVMITKDGHAKVLDFGIAKVLGAGDDAPVSQKDAPESFRTQQGRIVGTPKYMAPEQLRGDPIDARVDQWAWACVAYELLTGSMPDREETPQPISLTMPEVPFDVAAAIVRARSIDPEKRFDSMRALLAAFAVQPSGEVTVSVAPARRDPDAPTTTGPVRRSWPRVALVALASFAIAGAAVFAWSRHRAANVTAKQNEAPACAFTVLPVTGSLGPAAMQFFASVEPQQSGLTSASLRYDPKVGDYVEQVVSITRESATPRTPNANELMAFGTPMDVFVIAAPEARYYSVQQQPDDMLLVTGRSAANDAIVSVERLLPVEGFKPRTVWGVLSPHTKPPTVAYLVQGVTLDEHAKQRASVRFYGRHIVGALVFAADVGQEIRFLHARGGDHAVAYTFAIDGEVHAGAFELVDRVEERSGKYGLVTQVVSEDVVGEKKATPIGPGRARASIAFDGDDIHAVWPDPDTLHVHHATFRASADSGVAHELVDAPTNGTAIDLRITNRVFSMTWHDGARIWYGEGDSVAHAVKRAASAPESLVAAGPWVARSQTDALVAWISGGNNDVHRAIVTCR